MIAILYITFFPVLPSPVDNCDGNVQSLETSTAETTTANSNVSNSNNSYPDDIVAAQTWMTSDGELLTFDPSTMSGMMVRINNISTSEWIHVYTSGNFIVSR